MTIRPAIAADAARLAEFGAQAFAAAFAADNTPEDMAAYLSEAFSPAKQQAELADPASRFLIAAVGGAMAGYAQLKVGSAEEGVTGRNPIELVRIYTNSERIGQGIGAALMNACLEAARQGGHDVIWLGVWEKNHRAQAFYRRWGFMKVGTHIFQLGADAQTDWILQRQVNE
ncbi:MAG: GNAT family N-acetyltransferase [Anaerolineaceae bacterium]|nr:GNAT family N-acetyltransferase [Anaerolineaceae bacterium]MCB9100487.1 GNAT family N-acetyltransferase [Anaerolineales bacterium]